MNGNTVATEYNDSNQNQRQLCQIYAGADYNYNMVCEQGEIWCVAWESEIEIDRDPAIHLRDDGGHRWGRSLEYVQEYGLEYRPNRRRRGGMTHQQEDHQIGKNQIECSSEGQQQEECGGPRVSLYEYSHTEGVLARIHRRIQGNETFLLCVYLRYYRYSLWKGISHIQLPEERALHSHCMIPSDLRWIDQNDPAGHPLCVTHPLWLSVLRMKEVEPFIW